MTAPASTSRVRDSLRSWLVSLTHPMISPARYLEQERAVVIALSREPEWGQRWAAGFLTDLLSTLPPSDPWRNLSGRLRLVGSEVTRAGAYPMPEGDGATGKFGPFGTYRDGTDLIPVSSVDLTQDPWLAALAEPLPATSGALMALAGDENAPVQVRTALSAYPSPLWVETALAALRWCGWRRTAYVGLDDEQMYLLGSLNITWADQGETAQPQRAGVVATAALTDDSYLPLED